MEEERKTDAAEGPGSAAEVFWAFLKLGLTAFGGPVAHLGYFRDEIVQRRRWITEETYADIVALCQFLPGPASSQVGLALGLTRAGLPGAFAAWLGFTMPSAIAMAVFGLGVGAFGTGEGGWLAGLKIVAAAVVAQAVWGMGRNLASGRDKATVALAAAFALLLWQTPLMQIAVLALGGLVGVLAGWGRDKEPGDVHAFTVPRTLAVACLVAFLALLVGLPLVAGMLGDIWVAVFSAFYKAGSLVFGGGHVVLPLLQSEVVPPGWVDRDAFLAGYGAAQAVPGPLFTFSAYLGAVMEEPVGGIGGAAIALVGIFLPSFLLVIGILPFWDGLRRRQGVQSALAGVNAAVVGVLLAALYDPVITSAIHGPLDVGLALAAFGALMFWKVPPWIVVLAMAAAGWAVGL